MFEKKRTYSCKFTAESRRRSLVGSRSMQRPRLTEMRCAAAAAELKRQLGARVRRRRKGRMKKDLKVVLIDKERPDREGARN